MNVRKWIACALVAGAAVLGWQPLASAQKPSPTPQCLSGFARGGFDLPGSGQLGHIRGVLVRQGDALFQLDAVLTPRPSPGQPGARGAINGVLTSIRTGNPVAQVRGSWQAAPNGKGRFAATFFRPGPTPLAPIRRLGRIQARFDDPDPNASPGSFRGRWAICR